MKLRLFSKELKQILSVFFFFGVLAVHAQTYVIKGTVTEETGMPLPGVSVYVKNTTIGSTTDFNGQYSLSNVQKGQTLVFSYVGYKTVELQINSEESIDISMEPEAQSLNEVVVTALGIKREQKALGYAIQEIDGEALQKVQGIDPATSLSGKIAGVIVTNSTDFNVEPTIKVRGQDPLIVIDGIPYANKRLNDIAPEDIEEMSILKGATASALYGFRGENGAILITTKNGSESGTGTGVNVDFTTNSMISAGYLAIPEKQSVYGRGTNNAYELNSDQSWGTVMDGSLQYQWDPIAKEFGDLPYLPVGKDNFENFLEQGYILNNNVNVTFKGDNIALRSSLNWIENKGRYPNSKLDKYTYTLGGDINLDKFNLTSNLSYAKRETPNMGSNGYTSYDPMYSLLIWSPADWDVRDYKNNYWLIPDVLQNNHYGYNFDNYTSANPYSGYSGKSQNNPYFDRYEKTNEVSRDIFNADLSVSYDISDWLKVTARSGLDFYVERGQLRVSQGSYTSTGNTAIPGNLYTWNGTRTGAYLTGKTQGFSINSDLLFTGDVKFLDDKLGVEYLAGGTIFYQRDDNMNAQTVGGISIPGFFSLNASVNQAAVLESTFPQQVNSAFGRLALSWDDLVYLEATGRNDWSSTLSGENVPKSKRYYFYPSLSGSVVVSELLPESTKDWLDLLKVRGSWTKSKSPADIYDTNDVYTVTPGLWNDLNGATAPSSLYDLSSVRPNSRDTYEVGLQAMFLKKRLTLDVANYKVHSYDFLKYGQVSAASGYTSTYINLENEIDTKGWEVAITATPIKKEDLQWDVALNWSTQKSVWAKVDQTYIAREDQPWLAEGERVDVYVGKKFLTVPSGEFAGQYIFNTSGRLQKEPVNSVFGYIDPDWNWGINSTLRYKNWSLYASLDGIVGGLMSTRTESYLWQSGGHPDSLTPERALDVANGGANFIGEGVTVVSGSVTYDTAGNILTDDRVYGPNEVATTYWRYIKDLHASSAWGGTGTTADAYERTYFKLREISLTYNVPDAFLKKLGMIKNASISFIGQNVLLWSKDFKYSDPDNSREDFADPSVRYLGTSVKLSF